MQYLWIVLAAAFLIVEFGTVTLVSIWFVIGALAALAACLLGAPLWLQVLTFAAVSLVMLLLLRPFLRSVRIGHILCPGRLIISEIRHVSGFLSPDPYAAGRPDDEADQ